MMKKIGSFTNVYGEEFEVMKDTDDFYYFTGSETDNKPVEVIFNTFFVPAIIFGKDSGIVLSVIEKMLLLNIITKDYIDNKLSDKNIEENNYISCVFNEDVII
jgi:hypothetical protein